MNTQEIIEHIAQLKITGKKLYSNCFVLLKKTELREWNTFYSEESFCIINPDHGINRIWFYTVNFSDLKNIIQKELDKQKEYLIEIVTKDNKLYQEEMKICGFEPYTTMMRMSNPDISKIFLEKCEVMRYFSPNIGRKAVTSDTEIIYHKLWEIFDTRISHLQSYEEIWESIQKNEIYIAEDTDKQIAAILQRVLTPKSFYINQVYNRLSKNVIHAIMLNELKKYIAHGGKYVYAWVEEKNIASRKFHEKYGLKQDGLWDVIYVKGRDMCGKHF